MEMANNTKSVVNRNKSLSSVDPHSNSNSKSKSKSKSKKKSEIMSRTLTPRGGSVDDLTLEILLRLPVTSFPRFRCVCKSWNSLFLTSDFANNYLHRSATDPARYRLLLFDSTANLFRLSHPLRSLLLINNDDSSLCDYSASFEACPGSLIVGSCNGLICYLDIYASYLRSFHGPNFHYLNPSTKFKSQSPNIPQLFVTESAFFGFGYDRLNRSYKTVAICCFDVIRTQARTEVWVYAFGGSGKSASGSSWRKSQSFPFCHRGSYNCSDYCGILVNGTLNWLAERQDKSLLVVSFNIESETFAEVLLPDVVDDRYGLTLCTLGDCLCFSYDLDNQHYVLWQMQVYGAVESWTMLLNISYPDIGIQYPGPRYPRLVPFFMFDNGEVLLKVNDAGVLTLYNPRRNSFKNLKFQSNGIWFTRTIHIESLVSSRETGLVDNEKKKKI